MQLLRYREPVSSQDVLTEAIPRRFGTDGSALNLARAALLGIPPSKVSDLIELFRTYRGGKPNSIIIGGPLGWSWEATLDTAHHGSLAGPANAHRHSDLANIGIDDHHARDHASRHGSGQPDAVTLDASQIGTGVFSLERLLNPGFSPDGIYQNDIGLKWVNKGTIITGESYIWSLAYLGNGIVLAGTGVHAKIARSTDYGATWTDLGTIIPDENSIHSFAYLGNGIVLAGTGMHGKIARSTDYGATWTDLGTIIPGETRIYSLAYLGNGIVLAGTGTGGKIARSTDYGATWTDLGTIIPGENSIYSLAYLGNGIVLAGTYTGGKIARSTDYGATWTDLGTIITGESSIYSLAYLGNGIILAGTGMHAKIARSTDYGATWTDLGTIISGETRMYSLAYLANGIALAGTYPNGKIGRSEGSLRSLDTDIPNLDAAKITSGVFGVPRGGTGLSSIAQGGILYASALDTLSRIAPTAANQVLRSTGANALQIAALVANDVPSLTRAKITDFFGSPFWANIPDKPSTFPPSTHGAAEHTNVTRELFLSCTGFTNGDVVDRWAMPAYHFVDNAGREGNFGFKVPDDFVSFTKVELVWVSPAASGNMYWGFKAYYGAGGETENNHSDTPLYGATATAGAGVNNIQQGANALTLANLAKGDYVGIRVERDGTHANDTLDADVYIKGLLFTYIAEQ